VNVLIICLKQISGESSVNILMFENSMTIRFRHAVGADAKLSSKLALKIDPGDFVARAMLKFYCRTAIFGAIS
jgi:hypothetical protein